MTLIDRYVAAVRDHLPRTGQDDIINELADSLQSRMEDEEAARGRPLAEDEEVGHPQGLRPSADRRRPLSRRRADGDLRSPAHRPGAVPDLPQGPGRQRHRDPARGGHRVRRRRRAGPGLPGHLRPAGHPVRRRDRDLRGHRPVLGPGPGWLGSADRQRHGPRRRCLAAWTASPTRCSGGPARARA